MAQTASHLPASGPDAAAAHAPRPPEFGPEVSLEAQRLAFLRLISHELRTPLNSILGFSELLSSEILGPLGAPQYKEYAQIIQGSGRRLLKLVNQVLEIGRLDGHKLELGPECAQTAFDDAVKAVSEEFREHGVRWRIVGEPCEVACLADAWGLRTVLGHLVQNAIAATPQGGEVRLRAQRAGAFVDLFVEDDGAGIAAADLPRLFLPFEQGESALSRRAEGAGLGLTIAESACRAMGGRLTLKASASGGVSARVRLQAA